MLWIAVIAVYLALQILLGAAVGKIIEWGIHG